jgi:hypothetical protein
LASEPAGSSSSGEKDMAEKKDMKEPDGVGVKQGIITNTTLPGVIASPHLWRLLPGCLSSCCRLCAHANRFSALTPLKNIFLTSKKDKKNGLKKKRHGKTKKIKKILRRPPTIN